MSGLLDWFIPSAQGFDTGGANAGVKNYLSNIDDIVGNLGGFNNVTAPTITASKASGKGLKVSASQVDPTQAGNIALSFNEANADRYGALATKMNLDAVNTRKQMLTAVDPNWQNARDQADRINSALTAGEVPQDVQRNLARTAAFKTLGQGGGQSAQYLSARDVAQTSLGLSQQGQTNSMAWRDLLFKIGQPTQILPSDVMASSGLSANTVASVLGSNADRKLSADTTNSTLKQNMRQFNTTLKQNTNQFNATNLLQSSEFNSTGQANMSQFAATLLSGAQSTALGANLGILSADQQSAQNAANAKANVGSTLLNTAAGAIGLGVGFAGY
jgi:hypothetical protein